MVDPAKPLLEGSQQSLQTLLELHDELSAQGGGVIVVGGPRGVGKALLLNEVRRLLAPRGRIVLFGRAEGASLSPYGALREPAQQALAALEARGSAEAFLDAHARALTVLLPTLGADGARARDKIGFLEALRSFFVGLAQQGPVTALLADAHLADADTRDALRFLTQHLWAPELLPQSDVAPIVWVVALRTDDEDGASFARSLAAGPRARTLDLAGLSRAQLLAYLAQHPHLDRLLTASRGRHEDVDELLEALPKDTDTLLLARIAGLPTVARAAVQALAVLGRAATPDLLAPIVGAPAPAVAQALAQLVEQRLLVRRLHNGELLFGFARPHHLEAVERHLDDAARRELHQAIALTLEKRADLDNPALVAFHALRGTTPALGIPHVLAACERLLPTFAYGTAVALVERALAVAPPDSRPALLDQLIEIQDLRGDVPGAIEAASTLLAEVPTAQHPRVLRRLGELFEKHGDHQRALQELERAHVQLKQTAATDVDTDVPELARVAAAMADIAYAARDLERARDLLDEATREAPRATRAFELRLRNIAGKIAYAREQFAAAEERFAANLQIAEEGGFASDAVLARINTALARHRMGQNPLAKAMLERALDDAKATGDLYLEAFALSNLGVVQEDVGDSAAALASYRAALARFTRLAHRSEMRRLTWNLANILCQLGNAGAAQVQLDESRRLAELEGSDRGRAFVHLTEGDLALHRGQPGAALAEYEKARELFHRIGEHSRADEAALRVVWAALAAGDQTHAEQRLAGVVVPETGSLAHAMHVAAEGALRAVAKSADEVRGLAQLAAAADDLLRLHARDAAWRVLFFLAQRYDARADPESSEAVRARAVRIVDEVAAELPADIQAEMKADPVRRALRREPPLEAAPPPGVTAAPVEVHDGRVLPVLPTHRRAEWDARYPELVGRSPSLLRVFDRLDRIARTKNPTVLIRGESGTGKELVAAAVHRMSDRKNGPFVRVNCAALVETLLMSELFGHEKGSFTGALARKIGRFELARGGTIFLDEIGDISPKTQVSLLRVLQEKQFERVGGTQTIGTDAVVVCATHRDLEGMVKDGSFREDLYYRLRGLVVEVPALRERADDVPLLAMGFLQKTRDELGRAPSSMSKAAEQVVMRYRWPGNIRELQNVMRSVALFCEGDVVEVEHLGEFPELFTDVSVRAAAQQPVPAEPRPVANGKASASADAPQPRSTVPTPRPDSEPPAAAAPSFGDAERTDAAAAASAQSPQGFARNVVRRVEEEAAADGDDGLALPDLKRRLEFEAISHAMQKTAGNITRAAALLKMKRPRLSQIVNGNPELKAIKEASRDADDEP